MDADFISEGSIRLIRVIRGRMFCLVEVLSADLCRAVRNRIIGVYERRAFGWSGDGKPQ